MLYNIYVIYNIYFIEHIFLLYTSFLIIWNIPSVCVIQLFFVFYKLLYNMLFNMVYIALPLLWK